MKIRIKIAQNKKILKYTLTVIIMFILICTVVILFKKIILKQNSIDIFGYKMAIILSGSMEPTINSGDGVVTKRAKKEDIQKGTIIAFDEKTGHIPTMHRVIEIIEQNGQFFYKTKGDNNNSEDTDLVSYENVVGIYIFKINKLGYVYKKISTPYGIAIVAVVLLTICNINQIKVLMKCKINSRDDKR